MNGRGYATGYRPKRRRKRRSPIIIVILISLALLLALFLIVGNLLNDKVQEAPSVTTDATQNDQSKPAPPRSVQCVVLDIEGEAAYETQTNITKLVESGKLAEIAANYKLQEQIIAE